MSILQEFKEQLPPGWIWIAISQTGEYINGFAFKPGHRTLEGLPIVRIQNLTDESKALHTTTLNVPIEYKIENGDLLVSWSATLDVFAWHRGPALVNQHIFKVVPDANVMLKKLLFFWLKRAIQQLQTTEHLHGSTMLHINRGPFMAHLVPLPPLAEQGRIVVKLEELLSDLDAGVAELKAAQKKLRQYRQSLLKAAVDGTLTAAWREEQRQRVTTTETGAQLLQRILAERRANWEAEQLARFHKQSKAPPQGWRSIYPEPTRAEEEERFELPRDWTWATLDQVTATSAVGLDCSSDKQSTSASFGYIKMNNINLHGGVSTDNLIRIDATEDEVEKYSVSVGDVIFNSRNSLELVGKVGLVVGFEGKTLYNNNLIRLRFDGAILPAFACWQLCSPGFRLRLNGVKRATTSVAAIYAKDLFPLVIALPPMAEQMEISQLLNSALMAIDELERQLAGRFNQASAQRQNILRAAFSGQLVPQDSNDEPASVLLERIRTERAAKAILKKPPTRKSRQAA